MSTAATRLLPALFLTLSLAAQEAEGLLAQWDRLLRPWPAFEVSLHLASEGAKDQEWRLFLRRNGDFRLEGASPGERGRSVLSLGPDQWLLLPGTRHPLKLGGSRLALASFPDPSLIDLSRHYRALTCVTETRGGHARQRVTLEARSPARTHRRILLWWDPIEARPLEAELQLASGRTDQRLFFAPPIFAQGKRLIPGFRIEPRRGKALTLKLGPWLPGPPAEKHFEAPEKD